mmetsp:Transcript_59138/g.171464  ORF Transcript_59138/g.171464 Transcript_59138/m.171464 type:complete len:271 (+) Transcript_59138:1990-2802(+)
MRSAFVKLPFTSMMIKCLRWVDAAMARILFTVPSSIAGTPKFMSGRSFDAFEWCAALRQKPLLTAHSTILRSDNSAYCGLHDTNQSHQLKVPWSGKHTGKITLYLPSLGSWTTDTSTSSTETSWTVRHLKGRGNCKRGPKLTCNETFLNVTVGYSGLPSRLSGNGWGAVIRMPSLNRDIVPMFGPVVRKFSKTASVLSKPTFCVTWVLLLLWCSVPSQSKQMLSSVSPMMGMESATEKPMRRTLRGCGGRACEPAASTWLGHSMGLTSNM